MKFYIVLNMRSYAFWWIFFCSLFVMRNCADYTYFKDVGMWYKFNGVLSTFSDAYSHCKDENATLAVPKNQAEINIFMDLWDNYDKKKALWLFLGIHNRFTEEEYLTLNGETLQYVFHQFQGDAIKFKTLPYLILSYEGTLNFHYITAKIPFICERPGPIYNKRIKPSEKYSYSRELRKSYKFHMDLRTWGYARTICDAEGGDLAIITSKSEEAHITKLLNENIVSFIAPGEYFAFVGFHDLYKEGLYITVKDTKLNNLPYLNWSAGQPSFNSSRNCGGIDKLGQIGEYNCALKRPYICEKSRS